MRYRAEIDGLRALAVVPVILFHAGLEPFRGGFVGVDIFFVISGYLITSILIEEIESNRFSLKHFYERRARRILPALCFVMLICIPFAWIWMFNQQFREFSLSLVAVSMFVSNIFFWRQSDYFDTAVEEKPLLHTWSLAVEEQFYLFFPIFMIISWRFWNKKTFWVIAILAGLSFLLSEWGWRNNLIPNFYLATSRAWELFAGSIASFVVMKRGVRENDYLGVLGITAILIAVFLYDKTTPFPSAYTLLPVVGTMLLIIFGRDTTIVGSILSKKPFVGVGLVSYSAYLWHQPIFAFARLRNFGNELSFELALLLIIATFMTAYLSR